MTSLWLQIQFTWKNSIKEQINIEFIAFLRIVHQMRPASSSCDINKSLCLATSAKLGNTPVWLWRSRVGCAFWWFSKHQQYVASEAKSTDVWRDLEAVFYGIYSHFFSKSHWQIFLTPKKWVVFSKTVSPRERDHFYLFPLLLSCGVHSNTFIHLRKWQCLYSELFSK